MRLKQTLELFVNKLTLIPASLFPIAPRDNEVNWEAILDSPQVSSYISQDTYKAWVGGLGDAMSDVKGRQVVFTIRVGDEYSLDLPLYIISLFFGGNIGEKALNSKTIAPHISRSTYMRLTGDNKTRFSVLPFSYTSHPELHVNTDIFTTDINGKNISRLTNTPFMELRPRWTEDGNIKHSVVKPVGTLKELESNGCELEEEKIGDLTYYKCSAHNGFVQKVGKGFTESVLECILEVK